MGNFTVFGIDFGMSTTIIATYRVGSNNDPEPITIGTSKIIPSALRLGNEPGCVEDFGEEALAQAGDYPDRTYYNFKCFIGTPKIFKCPYGVISADELAGLYLGQLYDLLVAGQFGGAHPNKDNFETKIG